MARTRTGLPLSVCVALVLGAPGALQAQQVDVGSRIRITTGSERLQGEVTGTAGDSLLIRPDGYYSVRALCTCDLLTLQTSAGKRELWIPLGVVGAVVGAVAAHPMVDSGLIDDPGFLISSIAATALLLLSPFHGSLGDDQRVGFIGGATGAALGIGIGLALGGDRWRPAEDPAALTRRAGARSPR